MACVRRDPEGWVAESSAPGDAPRYRFSRPQTAGVKLQAVGRSLLWAIPIGLALVFGGQWLAGQLGLGQVLGPSRVEDSIMALGILVVCVAPLPGDRWMRARYGDQILSRDGLHDLSGQIAIPRERIEGWERSEHGLELRIAADP
ncbi:MAG TPA: hypothetical protein DEA08_06920, partial [Planctomycetes bacterium]|nr:hypothetical protein [Planctomycetota bacterium]